MSSHEAREALLCCHGWSQARHQAPLTEVLSSMRVAPEDDATASLEPSDPHPRPLPKAPHAMATTSSRSHQTALLLGMDSHAQIHTFPLVLDAHRSPIAPPFLSSFAAVDLCEHELTMPVHPLHQAEKGDARIPVRNRVTDEPNIATSN
ncbi:uncharacterized protein LOC123404051 [Hordeum vulgare subsp. vulgare]|uniref:uncharacterized protein LOC123404051 n=1 Tax=Hordeum vulgare subsp. vulgare TaxID=112509 RepID=UPI001D1A340C|nr:uncharacterized protein LOC123404051 [Hordeum vulgare subsp. vulgare]